jgi:uncharacterized RDD family membrane protein YckC
LIYSYAGLWPRVKAFSYDYIVISLYIVALVAISYLIQSINPAILEPLFQNPLTSQLYGFLMMTLPVTLYFAISESSSYQATWGKRWQGLKVVHVNGSRLSFSRTLVRTLIKFIPWELAHTCIWQMRHGDGEPGQIVKFGLILVWVLIGIYVVTLLLSSRKQAPYDRFTNSVVILKTDNKEK